MIKEKNTRSKKDRTIFQISAEYARTIGISFLAACIFTVLLSLHARSEMIKNLYANVHRQQKIDVQLAKQLVFREGFLKDLKHKQYSVCLQVGMLYEAAQDYDNARLAYELALKKVKPGVYTPYYRLAKILIAQGKFDDAQKVINAVKESNNKKLIRFKLRSYMKLGDKYYSIDKPLSAAKSYEKAKYYSDKLKKKDRITYDSIVNCVVKSYVETADIMVKNGFNDDAVRFLHKAEFYRPDDFNIRYKLAIIYSELEPEKSVEYFEKLIKEKPQYVDYEVYSKALMEAANIAEQKGDLTQAKYYKYKIHSFDIFINNKVICKNDIKLYQDNFIIQKFWFVCRIKGKYRIKNISHKDIINLSADFVLRNNKTGEPVEIVTKKCVNKASPLHSNSMTDEISVVFNKKIFSQNELEQYIIDIYLYKDNKYKTLVSSIPVPLESIKN